MKGYEPTIRSFKEIDDEFRYSINNIRRKFKYYAFLKSKDYNIPSAGTFLSDMTSSNLNAIRMNYENEINRIYTFELAASLEARCTYYLRKVLKRKGKLWNSILSEIGDKKLRGQDYLMYSDIIKFLKLTIHRQHNELYSNVKHLVEYRNWFAHGRGFTLSYYLVDEDANEKFDFDESYSIVKKLTLVLPDYPPQLSS